MKIKSLHKRIALNTVTNVAGYLSNIIIAFFITPFVIREVGDGVYGVWLVILAFVGYATMLEFGLQESLTKLVSRYEADGNPGKLNEIYAISMAFISLLCIVSTVAFVFVFPHFLGRFIDTPEGIAVARTLLFIVAFDVVLTLNKFTYAGMIYGFQLYYVKNVVDLCLSIINPVMVFVLIGKGYGIYSLAASTLTISAFSVLCYFLVCKRHFREMAFSPRNLRWSTLQEIFGVGMKIFTSATIQRAARNAQPLIIAWYLPTVFNTIFSIPNRLVQYGTEMLYVLSTGYMPIFSELSAQGDSAGIRALYFRYTRYILIFYYPVLIGLLSFGYDFIRIWMGPKYAEEGKYVLYFLTLSLFLSSTQPLLRRMLVGIGKLNVLVTFTTVITAVHLVVSIFMVKFYGISGMAATSLMTTVLGQLFWWKYAASHLEVSVTEYLFGCQGKIYGCLIVFFGVAEILKRVRPPGGYLDIGWEFTAGLLVYFLLVYRLVLRETERTRLSSYLARAMATK